MSPVDVLPNGGRRIVEVTPEEHPAGEIQRLATIVPVLPCGGCSHWVVCGIRPSLSAESFAVRPIASPNPAIRVRLEVEVSCDHYDPAPDVVEGSREVRVSSTRPTSETTYRPMSGPRTPAPASTAQSRARGTAESLVARGKAPGHEKRQPGHHPAKAGEAEEKAERARRVLAELDANGGDVSAAARTLGMKANAVAMVAKFARARAESAQKGADE